MKNFIIQIFLFSLSVHGFAQTQESKEANTKNFNNAFEVGIIAINQSPDTTKPLFNNNFHLNPFYSVSYERKIKKNHNIILTYRPQYKVLNGNNDDTTFNYKYKKLIDFSFGYKFYYFHINKFDFYFSTSAFYQQAKYESRKTINETIFTTNKESKSYGIILATGVNYRIKKNFYIGLETNGIFYKSKVNKEKFTGSKNLYCTNLVYHKQYGYDNFHINPISVFIRFLF